MNSPTFRIFAAVTASVALHGVIALAPHFGSNRAAVSAHAQTLAKSAVFSAISLADIELKQAPTNAGRPSQRPLADIPLNDSPDSPETTRSPRTVGKKLLPIDGAAYFPPSQLTKPAEPAVPVPLDSPDLGQIRGGGRVVLSIWVDSHGSVVETLVESANVPDDFVKFVEQAFRRSPFIPGERNGRRVGTVFRVEVRYDDLTDEAAR